MISDNFKKAILLYVYYMGGDRLMNKGVSLELFDSERFVLHFHKCPDVVEAKKPDFETESQ